MPLNSEGKRQLKGLGAAAVDLPEGNKIFGNESFCLYFQEICNICKKLRDKEKIHQYYTVNGLESFTNWGIWSSKDYGNHMVDLQNLLPDIEIDSL